MLEASSKGGTEHQTGIVRLQRLLGWAPPRCWTLLRLHCLLSYDQTNKEVHQERLMIGALPKRTITDSGGATQKGVADVGEDDIGHYPGRRRMNLGGNSQDGEGLEAQVVVDILDWRGGCLHTPLELPTYPSLPPTQLRPHTPLVSFQSCKLYAPHIKSRRKCRSFRVLNSVVGRIGGENGGVGVELGESGEKKAKRAYPFHEIEPRWQRFWEENKTFRTPEDVDTSKPKYYVLDMFPYPSGSGLHVGHPLGYTPTDILSRLKRMQGYNVLHPMGWDAFGLPAEQFAIETGTHPKVTTVRNVDRFRIQLKSLGFSYDWDREISTVEPEYYKWTQWIFLQLLKRGLAYQAEVPVNWCPALGTVLANEEVIDGLSERGGHPVIRKPMRQWMLKITAYADPLLEDLEDLDWPESVKEMQRNWIGRSEGAELEFHVLDVNGQEKNSSITVYTTRPDTLFGATYLVLAPEHPLLPSLVSATQAKTVEEYKELATRKSDLERTELQKEKTGVFSGCYAKNPASGEAIPIWVADYVLGSYGTGAIMAVPAHDARDHEFALKYKIPIRLVVKPNVDSFNVSEAAYSGDGTLVNSSSAISGLDINGLASQEAISRVIQWAEHSGNGKKKVNFKLRDWLFARQRYWGEPIPVIFLEDSGEGVPVPESDLPLLLPELDDFTPTGTGEPPLSKAVTWVKTTDPATGKPAKRETNTMPQWAGSCCGEATEREARRAVRRRSERPRRHERVRRRSERPRRHDDRCGWVVFGVWTGDGVGLCLDGLCLEFGREMGLSCVWSLGDMGWRERMRGWGYTHGRWGWVVFGVMKSGEHFVLKDDPSIRLIARSHKMSKSRGNVVNPDDIVSEYGADSLRLYEMFMGPFRDAKTWSTSGIEGVHRFLSRTWRLIVGPPLSNGEFRDGTVVTDDEPSLEQLRALHKCIDKVTQEIEGTRFNTGISAMMEFLNAAYKWENQPRSIIKPFVLLLSPYAPHIAEELWSRLGYSDSLAYETFPKANPVYLKDTTIMLPVQINGKMRGTILIETNSSEEDAFALASSDEKLSKYLDSQTIKKRIYVPGKILNVIVVPQNAKVSSTR
uniref:leucine--tRNA ligase n=1 Tax=Kalanchoe fedtschenkoi TaxID=63787 RepID=A0A7N0TNR5_KALFE